MPTNLIIILAIGAFGGVLSGLLGIGGGIFLVPVMVYALEFSQQKAQGTTLAMLSMPVALLAAYNYYKGGYVDWRVAVILGIGFVGGSYFGSKIAVSIDTLLMQRIFGVLLLLIGIKMLLGK